MTACRHLTEVRAPKTLPSRLATAIKVEEGLLPQAPAASHDTTIAGWAS